MPPTLDPDHHARILQTELNIRMAMEYPDVTVFNVVGVSRHPKAFSFARGLRRPTVDILRNPLGDCYSAKCFINGRLVGWVPRGPVHRRVSTRLDAGKKPHVVHVGVCHGTPYIKIAV